MAWDYDALHKAPHSYFDAVDAQDVEAIVAHFADDATLTIQTANITHTGKDEIRRRVQTVAEMRTPSTRASGQTTRTAANTSSGKRMRFASGPPYSSSRLFVSGQMNEDSR